MLSRQFFSRRLILLVLAALPQSGSARPSKTDTIDDFCRALRSEFAEAEPRYFAGPDPWMHLDHPSDAVNDEAVATVYLEGTRVRWLILEMQGPNDGWFETTNYFFDENGLLRKRERRLQQYSSHIQVEDDRYFMNRKEIKASYHHSVLRDEDATAPQRENWETFSDPEAPFYSSSADLPEIFWLGAFERLADLHLFVSHPFVLKWSGR